MEEPIRKKTQQDKDREEIERKAAQSTLDSIATMFGDKKTKIEPYKYRLRENFSYSNANGHMNDYKKAVSTHQQNVNKPFNKFNGVGV